jgi:hypothetical protein
VVSIIALLSSLVENVLDAVAAAMAVPGQGIGFRGAHPPRRKTGSWLTALPVLWVLFPVPSLAEGAYTFGQSRVGQQANFCLDEAAALAVADVFRDQGARPGYGALSQSPACRRRVLDFTPRAMLTRVEIEGDDRYWVNFVRVDLASGGRSVLVTTREIRQP